MPPSVDGRKHGWLRLSSVYGSHRSEAEDPIPHEAVVNFFCPHCHADLNGVPRCTDCAAPMIGLMVQGGGRVQVCSRRGCRGHMLDLNGVNA